MSPLQGILFGLLFGVLLGGYSLLNEPNMHNEAIYAQR